MNKLSIVELRKSISEVINATHYTKERHVVVRHNKPVAAIVSIEDYELLESLEDKVDLDDARRVLNDPKSQFLDWDSVKADL